MHLIPPDGMFLDVAQKESKRHPQTFKDFQLETYFKHFQTLSHGFFGHPWNLWIKDEAHIPQELCSEVDAPRRPSRLLCGR